jgi:FixJ family two-component response regulator
VAVVDDDESVREALPDFLAVKGFDALAYSSAEAFLLSGVIAQTRCLILDVAMPGMSGPQLYRKLRTLGHTIPTIFISARCNDEIRADLMRLGAIACLSKPFNGEDLRMALQMAVGAA